MRTINDLINLKNRKAIISGGAGHIGRAIAGGLVELGAKVGVLDKNQKACEQTVSELEAIHSTGAKALSCDLLDEKSTRSAIQKGVSDLGGLDILIHCAAYVGDTKVPGWSTSFENQTVEAWDEAFRVNLTAAFIMAQESKAALEESGHGSIILFGSIYGVGGPDFSLYEGLDMNNPAGYGASKGGLLQLTKYLSTAMAPSVRVNAISPGGVARNQNEQFQKRYMAKTPLGRMATEEDLKGATVFLASDMSSYMTGQNLMLDGGWSAW